MECRNTGDFQFSISYLNEYKYVTNYVCYLCRVFVSRTTPNDVKLRNPLDQK